MSVLFSDESQEGVTCQSSWRKDVYVQDNGCQTSEVLTDHVASQSIRRKQKGVQTEVEEVDYQNVEYDEHSLAKFLKRVAPVMLEELDQNMRSHAFDGYDVSWDDKINAVTCAFTLSHDLLLDDLQVTSLSWNFSGAVIAAAFGDFRHEGWCVHKSALCTWNIDKRNMNTGKPDMSIDVSSCLMSISFHPKIPTYIAGGTFNGEVFVWDTSRQEDPLVATSGIDDDSHREPVTKVQWVPVEGKLNQYNIVSTSGDGKILKWSLNLNKQKLELVSGNIILAESLPRSQQVRGRLEKEIGVTNISYNIEDKSTFIIGSDSGGIFKCSQYSRGTPAASTVVSSVPLCSPVTFTFQPHKGPVNGLECSPYHRSLFITCGSDSSARIYNMLQNKPMLTLESGCGYLYSVQWSPVRPLVFAITSADGHLLIYDLGHSQAIPSCKLEVTAKNRPVHSLQFNPKQRQFLATGDADGSIKIWRLSDELSSQKAREIDTLEEFSKVAME